MIKTYQTFIFESYSFDWVKKTAFLHYSFDGELFFEEQFCFNFEFLDSANKLAVKRAVRQLWLMAGISYYKAILCGKVVVRGEVLTTEEAAFFERNYRLGLGELLYSNNLPLDHKIGFRSEKGQIIQPELVTGLSGVLLPLGGGKDSLLSADLLHKSGIDFATWTVGHSKRFAPMIQKIGHPHLAVSRKIDPAILELNARGALNGHVPISAILAFAAIVTALLIGKKDIILSNEYSANEPTVVVNGVAVNHQFSKTMEFEQDLQSYITNVITPSLNYFSILRPFTELAIAKHFTGNVWDNYFGVFSSCNRNFGLTTTGELIWCGICPKCAFVFLLFAPFVPKAELLGLFNGKNLFLDPALHGTYDDLLGLTAEKPFECVGEAAEVREAMRLSQATGNYPELAKYQLAAEEYDYQALRPSSMPDDYLEIVRGYCQLAN